jgi:hypothetical protein
MPLITDTVSAHADSNGTRPATGTSPAPAVSTPPVEVTTPPVVHTVPVVDIDQLIVRVAAPGDREALAELALRAGSERPTGALMVGELDGRLVAAVSLGGPQAVTEPTPCGAAAAAVVRYRVAHLSARRRTQRSIGSPRRVALAA